MNLSTITRPLALIAVGALALAGCAAAEAEPNTEPKPEPEPVAEAVDDFTETDEFDQIIFDVAWAALDQDGRETICWAVDELGRDWVIGTWDSQGSSMDAETAYPLIVQSCEEDGLL